MHNKPSIENRPLTWAEALLWSMAAIISFHLAFSSRELSCLILIFVLSMFVLRKVSSGRKAFYFGIAIGFCCYAPQLAFFWKIFGAGAIALWLVLSFWLGLFLLLAQVCTRKCAPLVALVLLPFLWLGIEYFRSELYYLRFSWFTVGYAFFLTPNLHAVAWLGVYGLGFVLAVIAAVVLNLPGKRWIWTSIMVTVVFVSLNLGDRRTSAAVSENKGLRVAGIQMEFPSEKNVLEGLTSIVKKSPQTQLLILSEYTFLEPIPQKVKDWCKENRRYLIVGGQDPSESTYYNTAFVISPDGEIVFKQAKAVPIQFFKDGLPAEKQRIWDSPWGKIGICICYDLSYRRVVDELVRQGAQALIVPTMDVVDWGKQQHVLHGWIAPMRASEFDIPVVRVASSGISQIVNRKGLVEKSAPFPGEDEIIEGTIFLANPEKASRLPIDHYIGPFSVLITAGVVVWLAVYSFRRKLKSNS